MLLLLMQRAIRSAEAFTVRQEIPAGRGNQAGPVRMTDTGRSVRRAVNAEGTAQRREDCPAAADAAGPAPCLLINIRICTKLNADSPDTSKTVVMTVRPSQ